MQKNKEAKLHLRVLVLAEKYNQTLMNLPVVSKHLEQGSCLLGQLCS